MRYKILYPVIDGVNWNRLTFFRALFSIFFLINLPTYAQILPVKLFSIDDNLAHSSVTSIAQGKDGYLWFTTLNGISRFDGSSMTNFSTDDGLIDRLIISSYADSKGNLWFGSFVGVSKFSNGKFFNYSKENGLNGSAAWTICEDDNNNIWIGSKGNGITIISPKNQITFLTKKDGLPSDSILSIVRNSNGNIVIATPSEITVYESKKFSQLGLSKFIAHNSIRTAVVDSKNNIWVGTINGLVKCTGKSFSLYDSKHGIKDARIISIYADSHGYVWVGTRTGLTRFDGKSFFTYGPKNGVSSSMILSIGADNEGNIWAGTYEEGVLKFPPRVFSYYNKSLGLSSDVVNGTLPYKDNKLLIATSSGLNILDNNDHSIEKVKSELSDNFIHSMCFDENGDVLLGTPKGLARYRNGIVSILKPFNSKAIFALFKDSKNNIWIGTIGSGLYKMSKQKTTFYNVDSGFPDNSVYSFFEDNDGTMWLGTSTGQIVKFVGDSYTVIADSSIFKQAAIHSILKDKNGVFWFATQGAGLISYHNNKFKVYDEDNGLSSRICYSVLECDNGNLWVGTDRGLNKFDRKNSTIYTTKNGLPSNHFIFNSAVKDENGKIWFGSTKGLIAFDTKQKYIASINPPIHITKFKVFDEVHPFNSNIELNYDQNQITVDFQGICFSNPDKLKYKYRLKNLDKSWNNTPLTQAKYTNLPSGKYVFEVVAVSESGNSSLQTASMSFIIHPAFWNTYWFQLLIAFAAFGGAYGYYLQRVRRYKEKNVYLEKIVGERTTDLLKEKEKTESLLRNIIPADLVIELKENGFVKPTKYESVSILFSDFQNFTLTASELSTEQLIAELNDLFENFDKITTTHQLEKLKTMGDSYMAAGGIPLESKDHAIRTVKASLKMQEYLIERNQTAEVQWHMRIGINTGKIIAGIVGIHKFSYDVWGDTVNIANLIERECDPDKVNISDATFNLIKDHFDCEINGTFTTKWGKEVFMYYVLNEKI